MNHLKEKSEDNIETFNSKVTCFHLKKVGVFTAPGTYERFVNWVIGEFDLYLINEGEILKVYFPNGWFNIMGNKNESEQYIIEINVKGTSKMVCEEIMVQLEYIYNHIVLFNFRKRDHRVGQVKLKR
ncbi:hypothetical protein [Algibacter mikhailovii]|nr:hypothetical protein [Algibacter mikhailovii]